MSSRTDYENACHSLMVAVDTIEYQPHYTSTIFKLYSYNDVADRDV